MVMEGEVEVEVEMEMVMDGGFVRGRSGRADGGGGSVEEDG